MNGIDLKNDERGVDKVDKIIYELRELRRELSNLKMSDSNMRYLSVYLQKEREVERIRIARMIHDELGQLLTALKMDMVWLKRRLGEDQWLQLEKTRSMELIEKSLQMVRKISSELRPAVLDHLGLVSAIDWLTKEFTGRTGISCEVNLPSEDMALDREISIVLYRILEEVLVNIIYHSKTTITKVDLEEKDGCLELRMRYNGEGVNEEMISGKRHYGLIGMREWVGCFGGELRIGRDSNKYEEITVVVPLHTDVGKVPKNPRIH
jgi:two-component system sensor histidine kinase UhpB